MHGEDFGFSHASFALEEDVAHPILNITEAKPLISGVLVNLRYEGELLKVRDLLIGH